MSSSGKNGVSHLPLESQGSSPSHTFLETKDDHQALPPSPPSGLKATDTFEVNTSSISVGKADLAPADEKPVGLYDWLFRRHLLKPLDEDAVATQVHFLLAEKIQLQFVILLINP